MENKAYESLIEFSTLKSSLLPYQIHFLMAITQVFIALVVLNWGRINLGFGTKSSRFLIQNHRFVKREWLHSKKAGFVFLVLGLLILSPLLLNWHYLFSGFALLIVLILLLFSDWSILFKNRFFKGLVLLTTLTTLFAMNWEKADPAKLSTYLCFKALKWRLYERTWQEIHDVRAPKKGELAPDFELMSSDGMDTVRLSDFKGTLPVALIFGSHTCPPHSDGTAMVNQLYEKYKNQVAFINVYLEEAHPIDKWWLGESHTQRAIFDWTETLGTTNYEDPKNMEERRSNASKYRASLFNDKMPVYVDKMDNEVGEMYAAKPTRIYLIDRNGQIIYNPGFGPMSFNPKCLEEEIKGYLK